MKIKHDYLPNPMSVFPLFRFDMYTYMYMYTYLIYSIIFLQSIWSSPGPSPLEKLLEMQKQQRTTDPH